MSTEIKLKNWRDGQTQAERLCAAILQLQEFDEIDPQAPLGGADGIKDILCSKNEIRYVAAAYFPTTDKSFSDVKKKFLGDLKGVKQNKRDGFVFFTNQHLTIGERSKLNAAAEKVTRDCQIFHLERIRALLDQPTGYGIRLEYLRIVLTLEEQLAYFAHSRDSMERLVERQGRMLGVMNAKLDKLVEQQDYVVQTMSVSLAKDGLKISPPPSRPDLFLGGLYRKPEGDEFVTKNLSVSLLLSLHRAICFDLPSHSVGHIRTEKVYLGRPGKDPDQAAAVPPNPADVPDMLEALCVEWCSVFDDLAGKKPREKLLALAGFHAHLLQIHPFLDGNGRVARFVLMQQCLDLFGVADMGVLDKGAEYYAALQNADNNDLTFLVKLLAPVAGVNFGSTADTK